MSCIQNRSYLRLSADIGLQASVFIETGEDINTTNYSVFVLHIIEISIITITLPLNYLLIRGLSRTALFHRNVCRIAQAHLLVYCSGAVARIVLFLYQNKLLQCSDSLGSKMPLLMATLIRGTFLMEMTGFIQAVIIERALASYFIADYENKPRLWIWRVTVSLLVPTSFLFACLTAIPGAFSIATYGCFLAIPVALLLSAWIFQRNRAKLWRLRHEPLGDSFNYTLSIKFQLIENVRSMKIIMVVILIMATHSIIVLGLMIMALTTFANKPRKAHLCYAVMNLIMALSMLIEALMGGVALGEWQRLLRRNPRLQSFLSCCLSITPRANSIPERHNTSSIQEHFNQLKQAWER